MKAFASLLILALAATASPIKAAEAVDEPSIQAGPGVKGVESLSLRETASFAGTWQTERRCKPYTVILTQVGDKVNGAYSPGNGKISNGVVTDNKLSFRWTEEGAEGFGEFIMSWDGKNFTGTSSTVKPNGLVVTWKTFTPPTTPFEGLWQTRVDGRNDLSLKMLQSGDRVVGTYQGNGRLEGSIAGRVLRFQWRSDSGSGSGRFVMEVKNNSFSGTYNRGTNPDDVGSTWSGQLPPGPEGRPGPCDPQGTVYGYPKDAPSERDERGRSGSEADSEKKQAEYEERQRNAPVTFQGVWRTMSGDKMQFPGLLLQQNGDQVTGQLWVNRPDLGVIKEGVIDRNTLRFKVWRSRSPLPTAFPDQYLGTGELVMNSDGRSFKGTILGGATTGILVNR